MYGARDNSLGILNGLRTEKLRNRDSIPGTGKRFFLKKRIHPVPGTT